MLCEPTGLIKLQEHVTEIRRLVLVLARHVEATSTDQVLLDDLAYVLGRLERFSPGYYGAGSS